jgi:1-acyl-sn-glycerol-3-phosphate acyltransferase
MLRSLLFNAAFYVSTALFLVLGSPLLLGPRSWAMAGLRAHARASVWLLEKIAGTRMEVRGRENLPAGPCLVVAKHQSAWDTFALIPLFRDPAIVLKDELKWIPLYGWFCVKFEHILVKREKGASALKTMLKDAKERAAQGREIFIFPEGTRQAPGAQPDYKPGYVALYQSLKLPCVPLALNSGSYWPRRSLARLPGTIVVEILPALPPGLPRSTIESDVPRLIEAAAARLLDEARAQVSSN